LSVGSLFFLSHAQQLSELDFLSLPLDSPAEGWTTLAVLLDCHCRLFRAIVSREGGGREALACLLNRGHFSSLLEYSKISLLGRRRDRERESKGQRERERGAGGDSPFNPRILFLCEGGEDKERDQSRRKERVCGPLLQLEYSRDRNLGPDFRHFALPAGMDSQSQASPYQGRGRDRP
jgi:hypothetical protein